MEEGLGLGLEEGGGAAGLVGGGGVATEGLEAAAGLDVGAEGGLAQGVFEVADVGEFLNEVETEVVVPR